jgi:hypothetical protein
MLLKDEFKSKLLKNPSDMFIRPVEICMFQLSSALNLILHLKSEINKYKNLLRRAKEELERMKRIGRDKTGGPFKESSIFNFKRRNNVCEDAIMSKVNMLCNRDWDIRNIKGSCNRTKEERAVSVDNSKTLLVDPIGNTPERYTECNNGNGRSYSSSISSRLTIPHRNPAFKYVYKRKGKH